DHVLVRADQNQPRRVLLTAVLVTVPNDLERHHALLSRVLQRPDRLVFRIEGQQSEAIAQFLVYVAAAAEPLRRQVVARFGLEGPPPSPRGPTPQPPAPPSPPPRPLAANPGWRPPPGPCRGRTRHRAGAGGRHRRR